MPTLPQVMIFHKCVGFFCSLFHYRIHAKMNCWRWNLRSELFHCVRSAGDISKGAKCTLWGWPAHPVPPFKVQNRKSHFNLQNPRAWWIRAIGLSKANIRSTGGITFISKKNWPWEHQRGLQMYNYPLQSEASFRKQK